ncbi:hypothetical protein VM94_00562 [Janthinobacterium sp. KBS0711]|uniref:hypothetical protein n=1 Tax=Janthinobacterium sp. KBS0711 TaxID=1649647 RepID=UPI000630EF7E|nr:hypothetical protein [Janthinobacterium sp. KBS0711]KKO65748.1 hypothetical protein VM94_00562 [Janthinobacterium sp. KBS0711]TSD70096.1 hypothetical protein FFI39_003175 [Janthinobacterium sp. KBS0711]
MQLNRKVAALCLAACAIQPAAATAAAVNYHQAATPSAPEVRTRDLLLFGAGLILLAGRRRPEHDTWQVRGQD